VSLHDPINGSDTKWSYKAVHLISETTEDDLTELFSSVSPDVLIVDEMQFFADWIVDFVRNIQSCNNTEVYCAGLDQTAWREPFGPTPDLLALSDRVEKLRADCFRADCSHKAQFTQLIKPQVDSEGDSRIIVGGQEKYEARCGHCWQHPDEIIA